MDDDRQRRLAFELTKLLGHLSVDTFLASTTQAEWQLWQRWWERKRHGS